MYINILDTQHSTDGHRRAIAKEAMSTIKKAIERHRRLVEFISIWQNGQVVRLTAIQIPPFNSDE